jgi:hypothetical protein
MGMRRAQYGGMQRARTDSEIVDEPPTPRKQGSVFHAFNRSADPRTIAVDVQHR